MTSSNEKLEIQLHDTINTFTSSLDKICTKLDGLLKVSEEDVTDKRIYRERENVQRIYLQENIHRHQQELDVLFEKVRKLELKVHLVIEEFEEKRLRPIEKMIPLFLLVQLIVLGGAGLILKDYLLKN